MQRYPRSDSRSGGGSGREGGPLREAGAARGLLRAEESLAVVRPTGDPAGTVATRSAGLVEFSATLSWDHAENMTRACTLPDLPSRARCSVVETDDPTHNRREVLGEILALTEDELGHALETVLRTLMVAATLSDAILETRTARVSPVRAAPARALQALALDVRDAGFPVRFSHTWTPLAEGEIGLGVRGDEEHLRDFLQAHPSWRTV